MTKRNKPSTPPAFSTTAPRRVSPSEIQAVYDKVAAITDELYAGAPPLAADEIEQILADTAKQIHQRAHRAR